MVCAPDKLRGAASAAEAAEALAAGVVEAGGHAAQLPMADGGEGTLAVLAANGVAEAVRVSATDVLGRSVVARVGRLHTRTWIIESAEVVGLRDLRDDERDVRRYTSAGLGQLLLELVDRGAERILVALGGSATLDGGLGMLTALGAATDGSDGQSLISGRGLLDLAPALERVAGIDLHVLYDVDAPLTRTTGAALVFGPQKGLSPPDCRTFDAALTRLAPRLGSGVAERPGAGAAGGLGAALYALGATAEPGAAAVGGLIGLERELALADLCLTAEGAIDASTLQGKVVAHVAASAARAGARCAALGGRLNPAAQRALHERGVWRTVALGPPARPLASALAAVRADLARCARKLCLDAMSARATDAP